MFNDKYRLTRTVLEKIKTNTRRIISLSHEMDFYDFGIDKKGKIYATFIDAEGRKEDVYPKYQVGEEVAIAQSYQKVFDTVGTMNVPQLHEIPFNHKGWHNKMFVLADLMPHRIRITNIRVERLQDISEEDTLKEGLEWAHGLFYVNYNKETGSRMYLGNDYRNAFATLIDNVSGKGTWQSNPYVFVYDFELIK